MSQHAISGSQSIGASSKVLPMNIQGQFPLGFTSLISLLSKEQESSPAPKFESISSLVFSLLYGPALTSIHEYWKNHSFDYTGLCWQSGLWFKKIFCFKFNVYFSEDKSSFKIPLLWKAQKNLVRCHKVGRQCLNRMHVVRPESLFHPCQEEC